MLTEAASVEHVLVVPTALFHELGHFQGFRTDAGRYLEVLLQPEQVSYRPRHEVEEDPSFKQLIPYVIFRYRPTDAQPQLFCYQRGKGQGEQRLHAKWSVGVGGHISLGDGHLVHEAYAEGMRRELDEEVIIDTPFSQTCVGLINDDQTEVGRVHLGVVHLVDVDRPDVRSRESDLLEAGFQSLASIRDRAEQLESWSRICIEALFGL
jgi:predicted NUDIX family phosphoesterase